MIITGASNGIGAATAALFAAQGAKIAGFDIRESSTPSTEKRIDLKVDVSSEEQVIAAVQKVVDTFGTIDILCNIAGISDGMGKSFYCHSPNQSASNSSARETYRHQQQRYREDHGDQLLWPSILDATRYTSLPCKAWFYSG